MKATGIVRRIDDLGRIVIPKEIRRTLRIREGDPLEIFTQKDGEVIFKKYSPIGEIGPYALEYAETLSKFLNCGCVICDRDNIIAVSGAPKRDLFERRVSAELESLMNDNRVYRKTASEDEVITICDAMEKYTAAVVCPIVTMGDVIGAVVMISGDEKTFPDETEFKVIAAASSFLSRHMEN